MGLPKLSDLADAMPGPVCAGCGRPLPSQIARGPLVVREHPDQLFWEGLRIEGVTPTQARLLKLLVRIGRCSATALHLLLSEEAESNTLNVHISRIRRRLAAASGGRAQIRNIRGYGYELVIEGRSPPGGDLA
jgi:DNA-binding response OmpR family regulator